MRACDVSALVLQQALDDLERVVAPPEPHELPGGDPELDHRAVDVLDARQRLGKAQVRQRVGRIELDNLAKDLDGLRVAVLALQAGGDLVERRERVARQPELLVELGELRA